MPEWNAEIALGEAEVRELVAAQFPEVDLAGLAPFAEGWDNALWTTGEGTAFRFPRRSIAIPGVEREIAVLPGLAPRLPLPIPAPAYVGRPQGDYPWPWFGTPLLPGREIRDGGLVGEGRREAFGRAFGRFLRALHDPSNMDRFGAGLPRDPMGRADMQVRVGAARERFAQLERLGIWHAPPSAIAILEEASTLPAATGEALVHGDLHVRHVLVDDAGLPSAVIDWGDLCVGDPAIDLPLYWSQLDPTGRAAFREAYGDDDLGPDRLLRARVLALFLDAALAAYAHDTGDDALLRTTLDGLDRTLID